MSDDTSAASPEGTPQPMGGGPAVDAFPLLPSDPPRISNWWLDARLVARASGVTFLPHAPGQPASLLLLLPQGAAADAAARERLAGEVNKMSAETVIARGGQGQDEGRLASTFHSESDDPVASGDNPPAPWVVLAWDGTRNALAEADRLLRAVDLSGTPALGTPSGPGYSLHWITDPQPGKWRLWPLSWPGRKDRSGWVPMLASWLLIVLLATLALLIAVLMFQNSPTGGGGGGGGGESSESASASPSEGSGSGSESASPSESDSASPSDSPGNDGSPSQTPSMNAPGEGSATATDSSTPQQSRL